MVVDKNKIKILEVLEATVGGTRRHLISLITHLDSSRFDIEVAAPKIRVGTEDDRGFVDEVLSLSTTIHYVNMVREIRPFQDFQSFLQLYKLIRAGNYDVVHLHSSKAGFIGRIAAKLNGVPTVYTPNGLYYLDARNVITAYLFLYLEKAAGRFTDTIIAVSDSERESIIANKLIQPNKVVTIPNGIDPTLFQKDLSLREKVRADLGLPANSLIVGTVSRFIPQKDPFTLVRTAALVSKFRPDVYFVWCGEGSMRLETETLAQQLGIYESFRFLGYRDDVREIMNAFDIYLLTSVFEGLPYTLLEVMSFATPVVATNVVGTRDVVRENETGLLAEAGCSDALADALLILLDDEQKRTEFGQNGKRIVQNIYTLDKMVENVATVYESLVNRNRSYSTPVVSKES